MLTTAFIPIKRLAGELIISQTRNQSRCMLTTRELIFQKPHTTYHLLLDDVLGLVSYTVNDLSINTAWRRDDFYKITTRELSIIHRSGRHSQQAADLILPIHGRILRSLQEYHDLTVVS